MGMSRRLFVGGLACSGATGAIAQPSDRPDMWLGATPYLDIGHANVQAVVGRVTSDLQTDRNRALSLFSYVRDDIAFGFASGFWDAKASAVITAGRGYCNTKSTLFVTLLRASGIPARQVFVDIDAAVLGGIVSTGTPFVDHSYTEVFLDGAWRATDAYIIDLPLFIPARRRALAEGRRLGYGVHADGTMDWDGQQPAFAQYRLDQADMIGRRTWGPYADIGAFYGEADGTWNRLNALLRAGFGILAADANRQADTIRRDA